MKSRLLIYDIENMAELGWSWGPHYETSIIHVEHPQHLLSIAWKWLGESKVHVIALPDYKLYKKDKHSDKALAEAFWPVIDSADIVIGHNSDQFDNKMVNSMFMRHKMNPPSPYATVDTKKVAKQAGRFASNKLDDLGETFNIGKKLKHEGFDLWLGCDRGDPQSWKKMIAYNKQDVRLTEKLYLELRPWVKNHPAMNILDQKPAACPKCGGEDMRPGKKYRATNANLYQYYRCQSCGASIKARLPEMKLKPKYVN